MKVNLENRTAIVCGSTQGIGKAIAEKFAENGCNLFLISRNRVKLKSISSQIQNKYKVKCDFIAADFEDSKILQKELNIYFKKKDLKIDILINNVIGPAPSLVTKITPEQIFKVIERHLICSQILVKSCLPQMKKNKFGRVINIINTSYHTPYHGLGLSSIRASEVSWSKALSFEVAKFGITVNNILPGPTETQGLKNIMKILAKQKGISFKKFHNEVIDSVPLKRFASPGEIAYAALYLASNEASYVTGSSITIDGGFTPSVK
jgi:3-oxoacyl-[acyl-carrier protein] reductase